MEFYLSGVVLSSLDPLGMVFENVYLDTTNILQGFLFETEWNYPEANRNATTELTNFTVVTPEGIDPKFRISYQYGGLGNVTLKDINFSQYYNSKNVGSASFAIFTRSECLGNDDLTQTVNVQNMNISLKNNLYGLYKGFIAFDFSIPTTRKHILTMDNIVIDDYKGSEFPALALQGDYNDDLYLSNFLGNDYQSHFVFVAVTLWSKNYLSQVYIILYGVV